MGQNLVDKPSKNEIEIVLVSHMGHNGTSGKSQMEIEIVCGPEGPGSFFKYIFVCWSTSCENENEIEIVLVSCTGSDSRAVQAKTK